MNTEQRELDYRIAETLNNQLKTAQLLEQRISTLETKLERQNLKERMVKVENQLSVYITLAIVIIILTTLN
mgnify:CR=1 FL=1